jgi:hypothetical protein
MNVEARTDETLKDSQTESSEAVLVAAAPALTNLGKYSVFACGMFFSSFFEQYVYCRLHALAL